MKKKDGLKRSMAFLLSVGLVASPVWSLASTEPEAGYSETSTEAVSETELAENESETEEIQTEENDSTAEQQMIAAVNEEAMISTVSEESGSNETVTESTSSAYTVTIPSGLSDGTYSGTATVTPDEDEDFDTYTFTVNVSISDGTIAGITAEGIENTANAKYTDKAINGTKAASGISTQLAGEGAGSVSVDAVSSATCSSVAVIDAVNTILSEAAASSSGESSAVPSAAISSTTPVYASAGTSFTVTVTNPDSSVDYSQISLTYSMKSETTALTENTDYTVEKTSEDDSALVYTVTVTSSTYNVIGQSLSVTVVDADVLSEDITITSDASVSISGNQLTVSGSNGETVSDYLNNASSITLVYTDTDSGEEVTVTEALVSTREVKATYSASDIFNEDGSLNFDCAIFALGSSGVYTLTMSSQGFSDVTATVGTIEESSGYQIVVPEGLADGVYSVSGIYVDHDDDPNDGEQFTNYPISVDVTVQDGAVVSFTVSGASGSNTQYSKRAEDGINEQIDGNAAGTYEVDTVSTATCSSVAIIKAINAALQSEVSETGMSLGEAIYDPDGTVFTVTITNPAADTDYSDITLSYAVGKFSASLTKDTDYTVETLSETEDEIVYQITVLNSTFNVEDNDYDHDDMNYNTIGQELDVTVGEKTVGRVIITSSATVTLACNTLVLTGGNGETLSDYMELAGELVLSYEDSDGETVSNTYTLQWAHDVEPEYPISSFFNTDGSVNFSCDQFTEGENGTYTITITCGGFDDVTGTVGVGAHSLTFHEETAATCTEDGNVEYYSCSICGRYFSDETATTELTDVTVNATGHTVGKWEVTKQATASETGIKVQRCTVCGKIINTAVISATGSESETESDSNTEDAGTTNVTLSLGSDGIWYCMENGEWNSAYNGIVEYNGGSFFVANGVLCSEANGLNLFEDKWYFLAAGQIQTQYTGFALYDGEWFYITEGILDTTVNGLMTYDGEQFLFAAGRLVLEYNGLWLNSLKTGGDDKWYFIAAGMVQNLSQVVMYDGAWFVVENGVLASDYNGTIKYDGATFNVVNGQLYS